MKRWLGKTAGWMSMLSVLTFSALSVGCRISQPSFLDIPAASPSEKTDVFAETNVLQVGDLVVFNFPDAVPPYEERIKKDGTLTLPLIGSIVAAGKTLGDLQGELGKKYPRPGGWPLRRDLGYCYYVGGEVKAPGPKPYVRRTTVSDVISAAGGFTKFANTNRVQLVRANGTKISVKLDNARPEPLVLPGDSIFVRRGPLVRPPSAQ
jgi:polysaccharide export outer membrane protein